MSSHVNPRRKLTAPPATWERWDAAARAAGMPWSEWAVEALDHYVEWRAKQRGYTPGRHGGRRQEPMARRVVQLLTALRDGGPDGLTVPELVEATQQSRATVYRNLATLREMGLAVEAIDDEGVPVTATRVRYVLAQTPKPRRR